MSKKVYGFFVFITIVSKQRVVEYYSSLAVCSPKKRKKRRHKNEK